MTEVQYTDDQAMVEVENWKPKVLVAGALLGAVIGLGTAFLLVNRVDEGEKLEITPAQSIKMGLAALTFLRQITQLG
jgi:glucokinase